jgi:hypothetical protein
VGVDLEQAIDGLYQLPLDDFVRARNALAAEVKASGDKEAAARVKKLPRPTLSSWAANQAYWKARPEFEALRAATLRLQAVQGSGEVGGPLRDAMKARRDAQAALMERAQALLAGAGSVTPALLRRVFDTLDALSIESTRPRDAHPGRLDRDLEAPGFAAISPFEQPPVGSDRAPHAHAPGPESAPATPRPIEALRPGPGGAVEAARRALAEAETTVIVARRESDRAAQAGAVAEKRVEGARAELQEASRRFEHAKERFEHVLEEEKAARLEAERAAAGFSAAEVAREAARRALRKLE